MTEAWTGFQTMTVAECQRLLAGNEIGRLAVTAGALPLVLPVQYTLADRQLLVRTPGHHEVGTGIDGQVVAFETDQLDLEHGVGWCVSVTGAIHVVPGAAGLEPVHRWFSDGVVLALDTDVIVGHRVVV